ncbi:MAG: hypothetical protein H7Y10_12140 [Flavobacterium sp.]|nr:hypothetical protein [Flavobacterium sp.]
MNKYLYKKIEQAHSAYFENLIFIANEVCRENQSEAFEEFTELETAEIAKVLGWNSEKTTYDLIEGEIKDEALAGLLLRYDMTGFLAECRMPECADFKYNKGIERPSSWSVHHGICRVFWIYAESIGELVEKLEEKAEDLFLEAVLKSKSEKQEQNAKEKK